MSVDSMIARVKASQDRRMRSTVTITRATGAGTWDPNTGTWTPPATAEVYTGPALVRPASRAMDDDLGERGEVVQVPYRVEVPVLAEVDDPVAREDVVTVTASSYDPTMVGATFVVRHAYHDDWKGVQVLAVEFQEDSTP